LFVAEVLPVVHLRHHWNLPTIQSPCTFLLPIISFLPQLSPQGNSSTWRTCGIVAVPCRPRPDQDLQMVSNIACRNENFTAALPPVAIVDVRTWPPCREGGPAPRRIIDPASSAFDPLFGVRASGRYVRSPAPPGVPGEASDRGHPFAATAIERIDERILAKDGVLPCHGGHRRTLLPIAGSMPMCAPARPGRVFAPASLSCWRMIEGMINEPEAPG
jgi:hypothetical protein